MSGVPLLILAFFVIFFAFLFIGVPITFSLGTGGLVILLISGAKMSLLIKSMFSAFESFTLLAVFLFTLMGVIYQKTGLASLLTDALKPIIGGKKGGLAMVVTFASALFGALTGSANATCATFSKIFGNEMVENGYPKDWTAAVIASASPLGSLIPPSITCIVLGVAMGLSIGTLFIVDLSMGLFTLFGLLLVISWISKKRNYGGSNQIYTRREKWIAILRMLPLLFVPVVVIGGMYTGIFTATEGGAIGSTLSIILALCYRQMTWNKFHEIMIDTCKTTSVVMLLVAASYIVSYVMSLTGIMNYFVTFMVAISVNNAIWGLLFLLLMLLIMGCFIDLIVLCIVLAPTAAVVLGPLGINPYHVAAIFLIGSLIGIITPPVGMALFISCSSLGVKMEQISKQIIPFVILYIIITVLIILFPEITLWLPRLLGMALS